MKKLLLISSVLTLMSAPAFAFAFNTNNSTVVQAGFFNGQATIQGGFVNKNTATTIQAGAINQSLTTQGGAFNSNTSVVGQFGVGNASLVSQH